MMTIFPTLSIIVPVHNEERRLPACMDALFRYYKHRAQEVEIVLVENGSTDHTLDLVKQYADGDDSPLLVRHTISPKGKGAAVRAGMLFAEGRYRLFTDCDLSVKPEQFDDLVNVLRHGADVAYADREHPLSHRYGEPFIRHLAGRVFNLYVRLRLSLPVGDSQCGCKAIQSHAVDSLFFHQREPGWAFDLEMFMRAYRANMRVVSVPVDWYADTDSRVSLGRDAVRMLQSVERMAGWTPAHPAAEKLPV